MVLHLFLIGLCILVTGLPRGVAESDTTNSELTTDEPEDPDGPRPAPDYIIYLDDLPCLLATINVTLRINYKAQSGIFNEVYNKEVLLSMDEDAVVNGSCEGNVSFLSMMWWDGLLGLNFTFVKEETPVSKNIVEGQWWAREIHLSYDTSNSSIFPEAIQVSGGIEDLAKDDLELFKSPLGMSFFCDSQERITIGSRENAAIVAFRHVHIQPFLVKSEMFSPARVCDEDVEIVLDKKGAYLVPVIVACCLGAICIMVVIGYAISRKVNRYHDQSSYKPMD
ncbi:uncharacterized protein LOC124255298 isoform X1 [Haliotis rubra]|uniref:uncharacterized protein LOC124255298 isoform X1 n=1 Tax=Haliotis rubra TaxID=36100 RepID=UPI001EE54367|nr:uncharacterized protein LOC124255298 isoform X1 [Haliotis rubra]